MQKEKAVGLAVGEHTLKVTNQRFQMLLEVTA
jgi:hypothetical protein